jgi:Domain of unknown function (DUF1905)/Bacteriocin-protection, YdeI or OmpD-Associated
METPLVNKQYKLHKFPGKGGWTYAEIPEIPQDKKAPFGWVKVKGSIDDHTFSDYRLMPMGNGNLFLPVKAAVRKKLRKGEGDYVQVILFKDESELEIPTDLLSCLVDEPVAYERFFLLQQNVQREFIQWIGSAKKQETIAQRIVTVINMVKKGQKLSEKEKK